MLSLAGIRILDFSRLLPGPYATQLLANLGAEVIKIERPPEGDYARALPPYLALDDARLEGAVFAQNNVGKKSVALDFDQPPGRAALLRLVERADVLIESFRPGAMRQRGLDYETVRERNPRLIYCSLSGYGAASPLRARAGHDLNYLALSGILALNGAEGTPPIPPPVQIADLAGGMRAALEIAAALVERGATGQGKYLDVSLFDAAFDWMQTIVGAQFRAESENPTRGRLPLSGAYPCYQIYETADGGYMALGALEPKFWRAFCASAGHSELIDAQFDTSAIPNVAALFRTRTRAEWTALGAEADCCLEPLLEISEAYAHPQVQARGLDARIGGVPRLGEHTAEALGEAGFSADEIARLAQEGVLVLPDRA